MVRTMSERTDRDDRRREAVKRYHELKDAEEDVDAARAADADPAELDRLKQELAAHRRQSRSAGAGPAVKLHRVMWVDWIEIAVDHELTARRAHRIVIAGSVDDLAPELRASLIRKLR